MFGYDLSTWMLVFVRCSAMMAVFPLFSIQGFPLAVRASLGAMLAFLITPFLPAPVMMPGSFGGIVWTMLREGAFGLLLGFVSRIFFHILEFAGSLIATEAGLNMAATVNPFSNTRSEAPGLILFYLGAMIFFSLDLHHDLLVALQKSFFFLPLGAGSLKATAFTNIVHQVSGIFLAGALMAAPVIAVSFIINLVFSVIGRAVPQMNIFIESLAFRILAGLIVFGMTLNLMAQHIVNYLRRLPEDILQAAQLIGAR